MRVFNAFDGEGMTAFSCDVCKKKFWSNYLSSKYCSDECSSIDSTRKARKKTGTKELHKRCKVCGKKFSTFLKTQIYCSNECGKRKVRGEYRYDRYNNKYCKLRFEILERDNFTCQYCGRNPKEHNVVLHVDHIKPRSKGGEDTKGNLVTACEECNIGKGDKEI